MDSCLPDWNTDVGAEFCLPALRKPLVLDNELVGLLWQNGEIVMNNQSNRKQSCDHSRSKPIHKNDQPKIRVSDNPNPLIQDVETVSWTDCPIDDESFEKEFCANFLSEMPSFDPLEANKQSGNVDKVFKFGASEVSHVSPRQDFGPPPLPPPIFQTSDQPRAFGRTDHVGVPECSIMTVGSSHCASNQVMNEIDMSWASSCGIGSRTVSTGAGETYAHKVNKSNERETLGQAITSCSGGSGGSIWRASSQSNDTNRHKRKSRDGEESECPSDATELESAEGNKTSQKSGTMRRSRVAEVHNLSERKRRDRINEKMKALQELIPHSSKSDKASMLDEAIEYMKSLQLQIQMMWMGRGMALMMIPGMQHYMPHIGMGIGPPMLPAIQNLMRLSRLPLVNQALSMAQTGNQAPVGHTAMLNPVISQNQMQNSSFPEQYANYMGFHSMPNASQATNMFNFGFHSTAQQNKALAPQGNGNGSVV